jgi:hypothetical protein
VQKVVLINRQLSIEFLSQTHKGRVHDKRIAESTPSPFPQGSHLLQDLGFLAFTLSGVTIEMPTKKPKGGQLTAEQKVAVPYTMFVCVLALGFLSPNRNKV